MALFRELLSGPVVSLASLYGANVHPVDTKEAHCFLIQGIPRDRVSVATFQIFRIRPPCGPSVIKELPVSPPSSTDSPLLPDSFLSGP